MSKCWAHSDVLMCDESQKLFEDVIEQRFPNPPEGTEEEEEEEDDDDDDDDDE